MTNNPTQVEPVEGLAAFIQLAEKAVELGPFDLEVCDEAITDKLGFIYGLMQSEHLPSEYDYLNAKLVAATLNALPAILSALRSSTDDELVEARAEIARLRQALFDTAELAPYPHNAAARAALAKIGGESNGR